MNGLEQLDSSSEFVEIDPSGRYGRYNEILGKGASKIVYKAFDEYEGIEVAWNQVKLYDFLQSPEDLERLYCEIHLLKTLKHENIMKFYTSWVDTVNRNINFVTEMFTSGTLRQYRLKHKRVNIRAVKHWCRQILKGLLYLHSHNPPVIHRDLKCDNIFVNGNTGEVKIGDLGLAAILKKSYAARCVGTPEFMAPEVYEEEYNELVDIYSFGMCLLEMVTLEYPYSECNHPAQIYKKVVSGKKPEALYKVEDPEVREFIEKCLASVSSRLSARELLEDPFLQIHDYGFDFRPLEYQDDLTQLTPPLVRLPPYYGIENDSNGYSHYPGYDLETELEYHQLEFQPNEFNLFSSQEDAHSENADIMIKGRRREDDDGIFLRLRIADEEGRVRNIYFPFDIENDTALSVAAEMVSELDITDQDVLKIADMIDSEIAILVPEWKGGKGKEENPHNTNSNFCQNCASLTNRLDQVSSNSPSAKNLQVLQCSKHGHTNTHGRFEEITYQVEGQEECSSAECPPVSSSDQLNGKCYTDIWAQRESPEISSEEPKEIHCDEGPQDTFQNSVSEKQEERIINMDSLCKSNTRSHLSSRSAGCTHWDGYENEIRQELRWLKAKYQMQLRELKDQQLRVKSDSSSCLDPDSFDTDQNKDNNGVPLLSRFTKAKRDKFKPTLQSLLSGKHLTSNTEKRCAADTEYRNFEALSPEQMFTAKSFYAESLIPCSLQRATSLPVDALDV